MAKIFDVAVTVRFVTVLRRKQSLRLGPLERKRGHGGQLRQMLILSLDSFIATDAHFGPYLHLLSFISGPALIDDPACL